MDGGHTRTSRLIQNKEEKKSNYLFYISYFSYVTQNEAKLSNEALILECKRARVKERKTI